MFDKGDERNTSGNGMEVKQSEGAKKISERKEIEIERKVGEEKNRRW